VRVRLVSPTVPEIIFANWREGLHRAGLSPAVKNVYTLALNGYVEYCALNSVSVANYYSAACGWALAFLLSSTTFASASRGISS
jgi:hypothetical protein